MLPTKMKFRIIHLTHTLKGAGEKMCQISYILAKPHRSHGHVCRTAFPFLMATNPSIPNSARAWLVASHHFFKPLKRFLPTLWERFETTFPRLFIIRSFLVSPPAVYTRRPSKTWRIDPVWLFFVTRLGFLAFFAFFLLDLRLLERRRLVDRLRDALRFDRDLERFFDRRRGARGLLAVLLRDLLREREVDLLGPLGVADRRARLFLDEDLLRLALRDLERLVEALLVLLDLLIDRLAALGLEAVRRFLDDERLRLLADLDLEALVEALRFGARGAAARRLALRLAALRLALRLFDFFGALGFDAALLRDLLREREVDLLGPLGVADRRARLFLDEDLLRLALRDLERLVEALLVLLDLLAALSLEAVRRFLDDERLRLLADLDLEA